MSANDEIRTLLEQRRARRNQHRDSEGKFAKKTVWDYVQEYQLDQSDVRVRALALKEVADPERAVLQLAVQMHHTRPTDADRAVSPSKTMPTMGKQEKLWEEYRAGSRNLYGRDLMRYKQRMRERGLEIT